MDAEARASHTLAWGGRAGNDEERVRVARETRRRRREEEGGRRREEEENLLTVGGL